MKKLLLTITCTSVLGASQALADIGTIHFMNSAPTLVTLQLPWGPSLGAMTGFPGEFTFQLYVAPAGTTDRFQFTPTNVQGTNFFVGRFRGGFNLGVEGVQAGEWRAILVRGWSTSLGPDFETARSNWDFGANGFLGESQISPNFIFGGFDGIGGIPTAPAFGGAFGIQSGFALVGIPEPSAAAFRGLGAVWLLLAQRRAKKTTH